MHITKWKWKLLGRVWLFAIPWKLACQAPLSIEFPRLEHWRGLPFPPPGDLTDPGIEHGFPALQADSLLSEPPGKPITKWVPWFLIVEDKWLPWRKAFFPNENFLHAKNIHLLSTVLLWKVVPYSWVVKYSWFWWTMASSPGWLCCCCCCSVTKSCPTLCDSMDYSTPGLPVPHHLPEFAQVHVHWIGDAIQPSHLLSPSSPSTEGKMSKYLMWSWGFK